MPSETLAGGLGFDIVGAVVDGQVQGVNTLTSRIVCICVGVSARCGVGRVVPDEVLAGGLCFDIVCAVVNRQFQGVNTCAAVGIVVSIRVGARRGL